LGVLSLADALQARSGHFAVRVLRFVRTLARDPATDAVARQLARSAASTVANYRAARRARSRAEFIAKLGIVVEESDEAESWLRMLRDTDLAMGREFDWLSNEAAELRAIFVASRKTARANRAKSLNP
jgi:four helix bundle protein